MSIVRDFDFLFFAAALAYRNPVRVLEASVDVWENRVCSDVRPTTLCKGTWGKEREFPESQVNWVTLTAASREKSCWDLHLSAC